MRTRSVRATRIVLLLLCLPLLVGFDFPGGGQRLWRQADRAFKQKQYDQAAQLYDQARQQQPEEWRLAFNVAVAQAAGKKYDEAVKGFERVAQSAPPELRQPAEYNAGNCYLAQQKNEPAIEHYKRALYLNPNDMNAKWNLELAKRQQKQQQQQQKQQQKQDQKKQDQKKQDQQKQPPQPQDRKMDQDQAKRLLQSLSQADRDLRKQMAKQQQRPSGASRPDKDW
jgi:Ca-activated chloride channel family protein